jgi:hypothetical protein
MAAHGPMQTLAIALSPSTTLRDLAAFLGTKTLRRKSRITERVTAASRYERLPAALAIPPLGGLIEHGGRLAWGFGF